MAFAAGFGLARLFDAEAMPRMAGGAGSLGAVRVHPPDAGVGPGGRIEGSVLANFDDRPVALATADHHRRRSAHRLAEEAILGIEDVAGLGMVGSSRRLPWDGSGNSPWAKRSPRR